MSDIYNILSKEDLEKVALLSRLSLTESEKEKLLGQINRILGFVGQVRDLVDTGVESSGGENYGKQFESTQNKNRTRVDEIEIENGGGKFSEVLLSGTPSRLGDFVEVSQVLDKHKK